MTAALTLLVVGGAAQATTGPSGSHYPGSSPAYAVACGSGDRVATPAGITAVVYNGANGAEACIEQRDEAGNESGPVSGRVWLTPDGAAHADIPGAGNPDVGDRMELDVADGYVRVSSHWAAGEPLHQETTIVPLEGRVSREGYGSDHGYYSSLSETWVDAEGFHSESFHYDYYGSGWSRHSLGADGLRSSSHNESEYYGEAEDIEAAIGADGVSAGRSQTGGDRFSGVIVSLSPGGGLVVMQHQAGFNRCGQYGASDQGVTWDPVGNPGSLPAVVSDDDRPPCP